MKFSEVVNLFKKVGIEFVIMENETKQTKVLALAENIVKNLMKEF